MIDQKQYEITAVDTKDRFWGEVDFLEDYERVTAEISPELVTIAREQL